MLGRSLAFPPVCSPTAPLEDLVPKLTKRLLQTITPDPARDTWLWDTEVKGFGVRLKPSGAASFFIQYRNKHHVSRKHTLGSTTVLAVDEARERARKLLVEISDGKDPAQERKEHRSAQTLTEAWELFEKDYLSETARKVKPITRDSYKALWERVIKKALGSRPVEAITQDDVERFHASLSATPYQANRALAALSSLYSWRFKKRHNPCLGVERFKEDPRERILSEAELSRLGAALKALAADTHRLPSLAPFFALTALTGTRKSEWLTAKWQHVDWQRELLVLPDSKTGAKLVELPPHAMAILETLRELAKQRQAFSPEAYVLPGRLAGKPLNNPYKAFAELKAAADLADLRIHDLRHLFGSFSHRSGASQRTVAMLLGHKQLQTTERYLQGFNEDRKKAASVTAERIYSAMSQELTVSDAASGPRTFEGSARKSGKASAPQGARPLPRKKPGQ